MDTLNNTVRIRRLLIRVFLVFLWIGLGALLFILYRGHTLLVDNHSLETGPAPDLITVSINHSPGLDFFQGDRDRFAVTGSKHWIRIEFSDGRPPFEGTFHLPVKHDMYLLSIPKMIQGIEPFIEVFTAVPAPWNDSEDITAPGENDAL